MRVQAEKLTQLLSQPLKAVYLIHGEETLLVEEAADAVRQAARLAGANEREVWHVEGRFDWSQLKWSEQSLSLFSSQRLIELRLPSGSPGKEGAEVLRRYVTEQPEDTTLLIISGKIDSRSQKAKWFSELDNLGVTVPIWPVDIVALPRWIQQRLTSRGIQADLPVAQLMAERVEGNLFAAAQEVDKLQLLVGDAPLTVQDIEALIADNARFEAFGLMDRVLAGQTHAIPRIIDRLRAEGIEIMSIFSAVSWSLRRLITMAVQLEKGLQMEQVFNQQKPPVWDKQKPIMRQALQRYSAQEWQACLSMMSAIDKAAKGQTKTCPWRLLEQLCLYAAGVAATTTLSEGVMV
jgi:DNA polymerase-3 subunit delta